MFPGQISKNILKILFFRELAQPEISRSLYRITAAESVEKVDTLLVEDAVRSKIFDFRTAQYPRQYHTCTLEKPLNKRFFAHNEFFRRTCRRKNKMRL